MNKRKSRDCCDIVMGDEKQAGEEQWRIIYVIGNILKWERNLIKSW